MKYFAIFALIASTTAIKQYPEAATTNEHLNDEYTNCDHDNSTNKHGASRCKDGSECKGAQVCESQDKNGVGWCRGPDACPLAPGSKWNKNVDTELWNGSTHGGLKQVKSIAKK